MLGTWSGQLLLLVGFTAVLLLQIARRHRQVTWAIVGGALLAAAVAAALIAPAAAGGWVFAALVVTTLIPFAAMFWARRFAVGQRFRYALALARLAAVLHPSRGQRAFVRQVRAQWLASEGRLEEAEALAGGARQDGEVRLDMLRLRGRWAELLARLEAMPQRSPLHEQLRVRALGETGRLDELVDAYRAFEAAPVVSPEVIATIRLFAAAFLGRPDLIDALFDGPLHEYPAHSRRYWRATADAAAGNDTAATAVFQELCSEPIWMARVGAERRLEQPVARAPRDPATEAVCDALAAAIREAARYAPRAVRPIACWVALAALTAIQIVAAHRLEHDPDALYHLGMYWSTAVVRGHQWWRIVTGAFLHAGWTHFGFNAAALAVFGPFVEAALGRVRFAIIYLLGGSAGFAIMTALVAAGLHGPEAALGASGAVMALIGASVALYLRGARRGTSPLAARQLRGMIGIVALQTVYDVVVPHVSMLAHVAGLTFGFAFALAFPGPG